MVTLINEFIVFILSYHRLKSGDKRIESGILWLWVSNSRVLPYHRASELLALWHFSPEDKSSKKLFRKGVCGRVSLISPEELLSRKRACQCLQDVTHFIPKGDEGFSPSPQGTAPREEQYSPRMPFEAFSPLFGLKPSILDHYFQNSPVTVSGLNPSI